MATGESDLLDGLSSLLREVVDSFEKLEIVVHLYRKRFAAQGTSSIGVALRLPPESVAEALAALLRDGIITTANHDGAGWWIDPKSAWTRSIEAVVELYELDRGEVLNFMKYIAFEQVRETPPPTSVFVLRPRRGTRKRN